MGTIAVPIAVGTVDIILEVNNLPYVVNFYFICHICTLKAIAYFICLAVFINPSGLAALFVRFPNFAASK